MSIWAESIDDNARVYKLEYFKKYSNRPCCECLLRCVLKVTLTKELIYSVILVTTVLQMFYEIENTISFFLISTTTFPPQPKWDIVFNVLR